ncbi:MAG: hypothetical protein OEU54_11075, partial [Gemmatimonadota bacterium]|nr:hypothetical protein [Gemmatimonadota bacterium]
DEDLARRDFTINAMAWRPSTGEFRDPYGGHEDLGQGRLRAVGDATDRFVEDHLRVLRGLRFAGRFDLEIEAETRSALVDAAGRLEDLSAERVREELMKVLADPTPSTALDLYAEVGALETWFPEFLPLSSDRTAWRGHVGAVDRVGSHRPLVRLARLCVPIRGDAEQGAGATAGLLARLKFSNADQRGVVGLVAAYLPFVSPLDSSAQVRLWLSEVGDAWRDVFRLHIAGARGLGDPQAAGLVVASWRTVHDQVLDHPPLALRDLAADGSDLLDLGIEPGPVLGLLLEELLAQVLEDPERNERETLLDEARRLIQIGSLAGPAEGGSEDS